ncbi:NUDIX hydrolase [Streptomyces sp. NPDC058193]|uniref:NUDIX hydrolase n=1 Tax=Streptomyces sp. NPDC058193 TaxID=3346373 RepID=UPI0036E22D25
MTTWMPREEWVKTLPQAIAASCVVLQDDEGRVLLLRYGPGGPCAGTWWLPGGMLDPGEDPLAAARREVYEETGITLDGPLSFLGTDYRSDVENTGPVIDFFFGARALTEHPDVRLSSEHDRFAWMHLDELQAAMFTADPDILAALCRMATSGDSAVYLSEGKSA